MRHALIVARAAAFLLSATLAACSSDDSSSNKVNPDGGSGKGGSGGSSTGGTGAGTGGSGGTSGGGGTSGSGGTGAGTGGGAENTLSTQYPGDVGIQNDPRVILFDDFEAGWGRWDQPTADTTYLHLETNAGGAHAGAGYLRSTVTFAHLNSEQNISSKTVGTFSQKVDTVYWRFHVRFPIVAPNPHHWVRIEAGDDSWSSSGLANTVPPGDQGFWFDFDIDNDDIFNFYVYWHKSARAAATTAPRSPAARATKARLITTATSLARRRRPRSRATSGFASKAPRMRTPSAQRRLLVTFWIDEKLVGDYGPGHPIGTCSRDVPRRRMQLQRVHAAGAIRRIRFPDRERREVQAVLLDAYTNSIRRRRRRRSSRRKASRCRKRAILYDDVVVATERVGCQKPAP